MVKLSVGRTEMIEMALLSCLDSNGLLIGMITGFGSDGANVMVGSRSGLRLKKSNP